MLIIKSSVFLITSLILTMATEDHTCTPPEVSPNIPEHPSIYPDRKLVSTKHTVETSEGNFSVLSYNLLAQCYAFRSRYPHTKNISQKFRHENLMNELKQIGGATVMCFQEVTADYYSLLAPAMIGLGYSGVFQPKSIKRLGASPSKDGLAIFYAKDRAKLVEIYPLELNAMLQTIWLETYGKDIVFPAECYKDTVALVAALSINGSSVVVGTTHIPWSKVFWDVQSLQVSLLANKIAEVAHKHQSTACVLCGDFNRKPHSELYQLITTGELTQSQRDFFLHSDLKLAVPNVTGLSQCASPNASLNTEAVPYYKVFEKYYSIHKPMRSAYTSVLGTEPIFTFYADSVGCMDYIFHSSGLLAVAALEIPSEEAVCSEVALPNSIMPSDHVSIKAGFRFL